MDSVLSREFRKKKEKTWLWLCLFFVFHIKGCKAKTISERRKHNEWDKKERDGDINRSIE